MKGVEGLSIRRDRNCVYQNQGRARHKITWWWNKDTELAVQEKRRAYELWRESGLEVDKGVYKLAKTGLRG